MRLVDESPLLYRESVFLVCRSQHRWPVTLDQFREDFLSVRLQESREALSRQELLQLFEVLVSHGQRIDLPNSLFSDVHRVLTHLFDVGESLSQLIAVSLT